MVSPGRESRNEGGLRARRTVLGPPIDGVGPRERGPDSRGRGLRQHLARAGDSPRGCGIFASSSCGVDNPLARASPFPPGQTMGKTTIVIVEDDPDIIEMARYNLERGGFIVLTASDGEKGLATIRRHKPDVVLLDLMLPGIDGLEVCRRLRGAEATADLPVIMLTAKGEETDVVVGLEIGADEYVTKPFSPRALVARVRALLRRVQGTGRSDLRARVEVDGLALDKTRHEVTYGGAEIELTRAEFRLLWTLMRRPGRVFTRAELTDRITDGESLIIERNVDVHVAAIRRKLGEGGRIIATVRGVGYKCRD